MKVLHINTATSGGAAIAAIRLHKGMLAEGIDSNFLTLYPSQNFIPNHYYYEGPIKNNKPVYPILSFKNVIKEKFFGAYQAQLSTYHQSIQFKVKYSKAKEANGFSSFELFSFPDTIYDITETQIYQEADVIHLHWVADFLDYESFFKKNLKPVIWTLHDENPYLGGFHYEGDLIRNQNSHGDLNDKIRIQKATYIQNANCSITVVSPSYWLAEKARKSIVFKNRNVTTIRNGLDLTVFKKRDKLFSRELLGLPIDKPIFLLASADLQNYRKGIDLVLPLIQDNDFKDALFLLVGSNFKDYQFDNVKSLGNIRDELLMSVVYSAVDAFILPSREDNLPNTMLESIACETPIISFDIGDNRDFIGESGCVVNTIEEMKAVLKGDLNFRFSRIREDFEIRSVSKLYREVYMQSLN